MIEIPDNVEQWTYGKIVDLVNEGYDENDILEFKREINTDSDRLCRTTCAFANTNGGTIIFGINNNRETSMQLHERIMGMDDSDGLKRSIIDKITNIYPSIPIRNMIFRKSNIPLPDGKVLVILKITPSKSSPHQYNHIFYKRLVDGNEPMHVDEVSRLILDNQKNRTILGLAASEMGALYDTFKTTKKLFEDDKNLVTCITFLENFSYTTLEYFLYNQSYLYDFKVVQNISKLIEYMQKFETFNQLNRNILLKKPKHENFEHTKTQCIRRVSKCINFIDELKSELDLDLSPPLHPLYEKYFPK